MTHSSLFCSFSRVYEPRLFGVTEFREGMLIMIHQSQGSSSRYFDHKDPII